MTTLGWLDGEAGVNPRAPIARANPVAKLAAALLFSLGLVLSVDVVSGGLCLAFELLVLPWCGLSPRALWRRAWVVLVAAVPAGVATALFGASDTPVQSGAAITLRVMAIALPGVVLLATTDPTDLADALAQKLRLPARFVLSALAALRLFGVLAEEWTALTMARRARGIGGGGLLDRARDLAGRLFALLVLAIRRGAVLATTMESRGFGTDRPRTWARPSRFTPGDAVLVFGAAVMVAVSVATSVRLGAWNPLWR